MHPNEIFAAALRAAGVGNVAQPRTITPAPEKIARAVDDSTCTVYVLCRGEKDEGHDPLSAHSTIEGARKEAERLAGAALRWDGNTASCCVVDEFQIYTLEIK